MMDYDAVSVRAETVMKPDPMSEAAVEAVARAFCKRMGLDPDDAWQINLNDRVWHHYRDRAREAIAMHLAVKEVLR
jgi:hypothetical protein